MEKQKPIILDNPDLSRVYAALAEPWPREQWQWLPGQAKEGSRRLTRKERQPDGSVADIEVLRCMAYLDARQVAERLDQCVKPWNWEDTYRVVTLTLDDGKQVHGVECSLTVFGVTKTDVGVASAYDQLKGAWSDAFKRAAVKHGIGRFLYDQEFRHVPAKGKYTDGPWPNQLAELLELERILNEYRVTYEEDPVDEAGGCRHVSGGRAKFYEELNKEQAGKLLNIFKGELNKYEQRASKETS